MVDRFVLLDSPVLIKILASKHVEEVATDDQEKIIVAALVSDSGSDCGLLAEVIDEVKETCGALPKKPWRTGVT